ncbi:MAG: 2-(3-amino-3-carboxypropyl)histidine synthase [Candidatus Methanomethylophilaceae archaeon]|nr:2-(3-amino-3-carboxypropyl)histidine synthase [Candidatus Methanomethylophilaceae archaeon]MDI3541782.1 2-(3-amino-3-carboxypropyl)histidine synthase [Candidatus Methanomethylophilaceae archaeon]
MALEDVRAWIKSHGWSKIALQMPEGMKSKAIQIVQKLADGLDCQFIIIGDPCYGACDVYRGFEDFADALVHFGHARIPSINVSDNVLFVEMRVDPDMSDLVSEALPLLGGRVGLLATIQYIESIPIVRSLLEKAGKEVYIGNGDSRIAYPGQVLGCNCSSAEDVNEKVDSFIQIGEGDFHALAIALDTGKDVIVLDPVKREIREMSEKRDRILRQRFALINTAAEARRFLVIVSAKTGQRRLKTAEDAVRLLNSKGRYGAIVVLEEINPIALMPYDVDAYVNTACPRVAIDDAVMYKRPMLTYAELEIVLGLRDWGDYVFDKIKE